MSTWIDAAPPKATKKAALGALHHCIPEAEWDQYRVIKRGSRWIIQWTAKSSDAKGAE